MAKISHAQIERVKPDLYRLPLELFTMIMDYLDFPEILCLCEDPEFPIEHLQRRHIVDQNNNSILFYVISKHWQFDSAIKTFIRILVNWDVPGGNYNIRPLNATIEKWGDVELCKTFVEAGARLDLGETTWLSRQALSEYVMRLRESTIERFLEIEPRTTNLNETPLEPLHMAALQNNNDIVGVLLRHGANANSPAGVLGISLHLTTDSKITKTLLEHGADINARNGLGYTPLANAISNWKPELVALLVEAGADVQLLYDENVSALLLAIEMDSLQMVETLVDAKCDVNGHPGGIPPLQLSAQKGQDSILRFLIEKGADLAIRYKNRTVLHVTRCPATINNLLAYGADINAKDETGSTPFMLATKERNVPLMELYLMAGAEVSPTHLRENDVLSWVIPCGLYGLLKMLTFRCDIKEAVGEKKDLLLQSLLYNHEGISFLLLEELPQLIADGEVNVIDIIWAAVSRSSPSLVQKILGVMTKVEPEDAKFTQGLIFAMDEKRAEIVKLLPQALIKPINLGQNITSPLFVLAAGHIAAWDNIQDALEEHPTKWMSDYEQWFRMEENIEADLSILQTLIDHGANISRAEHSGIGILHVLAWRNDERLMSAFLAAGANPIYRDSEGHTPTYWAVEMSHHKMEKMLRLAEAEAIAKQQKEDEWKR